MPTRTASAGSVMGFVSWALSCLENPNNVQRYDRVHEVLQRASLDETASRSLLRQAMKEFSA